MTTRAISHDSTTWIDIIDPTAADIAALHRQFPHFHPLNLEDCRSHIERPKLDQDDQYLFAVLHFPLWDARDQLSRASEVDIFLGPDFVITAHDGSLKPLADAFAACQQDANELNGLLGRGAVHAFYSLIDQLVDYIFPILNKVDRRVHAIEDKLFESNARQVI